MEERFWNAKLRLTIECESDASTRQKERRLIHKQKSVEGARRQQVGGDYYVKKTGVLLPEYHRKLH